MQPIRIAIAMHWRKIPGMQEIAMEVDDLIDVARDYVHHLVLGDYGYWNGLGVLDLDNVLLAPERIAEAVADYGATLIDPPAAAFVLGPQYAAWIKCRGVSANLWTLEEGESNLQLNLDISTTPPYHIVDGILLGCPPKIIPALQEVIHHIVVGDFKGLEDDGHLRISDMTGADVEEALYGYRDRAWEYSEPRTAERLDYVPVDMPESAFKSAYVAHTTPGSWNADIDLWWKDGTNNGTIKGDLTLSTEIEVTDDRVDVQVMGLDVK
jgi:hypothetical protein